MRNAGSGRGYICKRRRKRGYLQVIFCRRVFGKINRVNAGFSVCNKLFHRELFSTIKFPYAKLHEDVAVIYKLIAMSKKIVEVEYKLYFYYKNPKSITKSIIKRKD